MQIIWELQYGRVTFIREDGDPKFYGKRCAKGEHALFHFIKTRLNESGNDFIKKRAQRDGHLLGDEYQPYIRTRSATSKGKNLVIFSGFYALRGAEADWNDGAVTLCAMSAYTRHVYHYRSEVERLGLTGRQRNPWKRGYSRNGSGGEVQYPWSTKAECRAEAKATGATALFCECGLTAPTYPCEYQE